jgi:hypothetical protein
MVEDRVRWIMFQFFKGAYLFMVRPEQWKLFNSNGRPVEDDPIDPDLIARLLTAGWIERFDQNMVATQKGLCLYGCGQTLSMEEPKPAIEWARSCQIISVIP